MRDASRRSGVPTRSSRCGKAILSRRLVMVRRSVQPWTSGQETASNPLENDLPVSWIGNFRSPMVISFSRRTGLPMQDRHRLTMRSRPSSTCQYIRKDDAQFRLRKMSESSPSSLDGRRSSDPWKTMHSNGSTSSSSAEVVSLRSSFDLAWIAGRHRLTRIVATMEYLSWTASNRDVRNRTGPCFSRPGYVEWHCLSSVAEANAIENL